MTRMTVTDWASPAFLADPYPFYRELRETDPVHFDDSRGVWMLMRYDDISAVLHDDARFTARVGEGQPTSMLTSDPPQHTRLRSLVNKGFTARRVQSLRPRIEAIVDGLLDGLESSRDIDLIADFAYPLPITVIAELLGVDHEHRDFFRKVGEQVAFSLGPAAEGMAYQRPANDRADIFKYFEELIERRRTDPKDDLASALVHAEDQGDLLSHVELLAMLFLLLVGGHETTVNLVTNGVLSLLRHPEEMERFRALADVPDADERFSLQRRALEEVLRYDSPVQYTGRIATTDLEIGGTQIHKGDRVRLILASANRDDTVFPDAERFDIAREPNAHLAFGIGRHFCLGSQLARLEGTIALAAFVRRFPRITFAQRRLRWRPAAVLRGLEELPLSVTQ
jgi:cytochrome P450